MHDPAVWRVATFNIWNRQGPWDQRLPLIREGLAALDADVIGQRHDLLAAHVAQVELHRQVRDEHRDRTVRRIDAREHGRSGIEPRR